MAQIRHACQYLGIRNFGHKSVIFGPIGLIRNPSYDAYFSFLIFWATFGGTLGGSSWAPSIVWGLQTQPKRWPTGWIFWANTYLEITLSKSSGLNPPPL